MYENKLPYSLCQKNGLELRTSYRQRLIPHSTDVCNASRAISHNILNRKPFEATISTISDRRPEMDTFSTHAVVVLARGLHELGVYRCLLMSNPTNVREASWAQSSVKFAITV